MIYALERNFKICFPLFLRSLGFVFVTLFSHSFPELSMVVWPFKTAVVLLLSFKWLKRIKAKTRLKYLKPSFICFGLFWIIRIAGIAENNIEGGIGIFFSGVVISGIILMFKTVSSAQRTIEKYDPKLKMNTEFRSVDEYFELYSRADNLEMELSRLKKEAPSEVAEAVMQREAGKLIPFFHFEMIYFQMLIFFGTPWM